MESSLSTYSLYSLGTLLVSLKVQGSNSCLGEKPPSKCRQSLVLMPRKCFKTSLCSELSTDTTVFIDIDTMILKQMEAEGHNVKLLDDLVTQDMKIKDVATRLMENVKNIYCLKEKKNVVYLSSLINVMPKIYNKHVYICMPSNKLYDTILKDAKVNDFDAYEEIEKSRLDFLLFLQRGDPICVFNSYEEMLSIIMTSYKIKSRI